MTAQSPCLVCENYEITSVIAQDRVMLTVDVRDLPLLRDDSIAIAEACLDGQTLTLSGRGSAGPFSLRFPAVPQLDTARLKTWRPTLCGLDGSTVVFAKDFPNPRPSPTAGPKPR